MCFSFYVPDPEPSHKHDIYHSIVLPILDITLNRMWTSHVHAKNKLKGFWFILDLEGVLPFIYYPLDLSWTNNTKKH